MGSPLRLQLRLLVDLFRSYIRADVAADNNRKRMRLSREGKKPVVGTGKKLYLALFWIAFLIFLFTAFSLYSFMQFAQAVDMTGRMTIPTLAAMSSLTGKYSLLQEYGPLYASSLTEEELQKHISSAEELRAAVDGDVNSLQSYLEQEKVIELTRLDALSVQSLKGIEGSIRQRILLHSRLHRLAEEVHVVHGSLVDNVRPLVYGSASLLHLFSDRTQGRNAKAISSLVNESVNRLVLVMELRDAVTQLGLLMGEGTRLFRGRSSEKFRQRQDSLTAVISRQMTLLEEGGELPGYQLDPILTNGKEMLLLAAATRSADPFVVPQAFYLALGRLNNKTDHFLQRAKAELDSSLKKTIRLNKDAIEQLTEDTIKDMRYAMDIKSEGNYLIALLNSAMEARQVAVVQQLRRSYSASLHIFQDAVAAFAASSLAKRNPVLTANVRQIAHELTRFYGGADNIFELCQQLLILNETVQIALAENHQLSLQERMLVRDLVRKVQDSTYSLQAEMREAKTRSGLILFVMSLGSLLSFFFISYFTLNVLRLQEKNLAAGREVARAKEYADNILASMLDSLLVVAADGTITRANITICSLLDYSENELVGQPVSKVFWNKEYFVRFIFKELMDGKALTNLDVNYLTRENASIPMLLTGSSMKNQAGKLLAIVLVARDMRESELVTQLDRTNRELQQEVVRRKTSEKMLQESHDQLEQKVKARTGELQQSYQQLAHASRLTSLGEMATGIAHEINQPLNIIGLAATMLQKDLAKVRDYQPRTMEAVKKIHDQVKRTAKIINNMRSFSRVRQDDLTAVDLSASLLQALSFFREQFRLYQIDLQVDMAEDLPLLKLDSQKFEQVVINFLSNARYALDEKEEKTGQAYLKTIGVALDYQAEGNRVVFMIRDNGMGMNEEEKERCLEPFFTTKAVGKGTGLGLSICHNIVDEFNGTIEVESEKGVGSTFRIIIPVIEDSPAGLPKTSEK